MRGGDESEVLVAPPVLGGGGFAFIQRKSPGLQNGRGYQNLKRVAEIARDER